MRKNVLPIGTVVELAASDKAQLMIIGYLPQKEDGSVKDYVAVMYPVGCMDNKTFLAINGDEIGKILFRGYEDRRFKIFDETLLQEKITSEPQQKEEVQNG